MPDAVQPQAAAPAAQPAPAISDDTLIEVKVNKDIRKEPLKVLRDNFQIRSAAEAALEQVKQMREQNKEAIAFYEQVRNGIKTDPEGTHETITRFISEQAGRPIGGTRANASNAATADLDPLELKNQQLEAKVDRLERIVETTTRLSTTERAKNEIKAEVEKYELYRNNSDAREEIELVLAAAKQQNPSEPLDGLASVIHTRHARMMTQQANETRDRRVEQQDSLATIPSSGATPEVGARVPYTRKDALPGGRAFKDAEAAFKRSGLAKMFDLK